jgi:hypothetical protein
MILWLSFLVHVKLVLKLVLKIITQRAEKKMPGDFFISDATPRPRWDGEGCVVNNDDLFFINP